jgi:hypothetical protein
VTPEEVEDRVWSALAGALALAQSPIRPPLAAVVSHLSAALALLTHEPLDPANGAGRYGAHQRGRLSILGSGLTT